MVILGWSWASIKMGGNDKGLYCRSMRVRCMYIPSTSSVLHMLGNMEHGFSHVRIQLLLQKFRLRLSW